LVEQHDEWEAGDFRYLSEASMAQVQAMDNPTPTVIEEAISLPELTAA
jgi:putative transposase